MTTQILQHKYDRVRSGCLQLPLNCRGTTEGLWRRDGNKEATKACIARIPQRAPDTTRESLLYRGTGTVPMFILVTITSRSYLHIINDSADGFIISHRPGCSVYQGTWESTGGSKIWAQVPWSTQHMWEMETFSQCTKTPGTEDEHGPAMVKEDSKWIVNISLITI